jgi:hypothetical protein
VRIWDSLSLMINLLVEIYDTSLNNNNNVLINVNNNDRMPSGHELLLLELSVMVDLVLSIQTEGMDFRSFTDSKATFRCVTRLPPTTVTSCYIVDDVTRPEYGILT